MVLDLYKIFREPVGFNCEKFQGEKRSYVTQEYIMRINSDLSFVRLVLRFSKFTRSYGSSTSMLWVCRAIR